MATDGQIKQFIVMAFGICCKVHKVLRCFRLEFPAVFPRLLITTATVKRTRLSFEMELGICGKWQAELRFNNSA